eukprot:14327409-Alexandrium_andersonii.AAC.1
MFDDVHDRLSGERVASSRPLRGPGRSEHKARSVMDLLKDQVTPDGALPGDEPQRRQKRRVAWARLRGFLCGPVDEGPTIWHYCPVGCHASRQEVVDQLYSDVCEVFLNHPAQVPAWNKWTKMWGPLVWFTCFCALNSMLASIM